MINSIVIEALKALNIPVSFQSYAGKASTYITFFNYLEQGEHYADNKKIASGYYTQVDIWSKSDYTVLVEQVEIALEAAGFIRISAADLFESDTRIYHKAIRFFYLY